MKTAGDVLFQNNLIEQKETKILSIKAKSRALIWELWDKFHVTNPTTISDHE